MPFSSTLPAPIDNDFKASEELLKRDDLAVPQLYEYHSKHNPNYPVFLYHDGEQIQYVTYETTNRAIDRAARYIGTKVGINNAHAGADKPVVGLLGNVDSITYVCTAIGVMRAGYTVFLISIRNAPAAVADMLDRTGASHVIVSSDNFMREIADEALTILSDSGKQIAEIQFPTSEQLFAERLEVNTPFEADIVLPTSFDMVATAGIFHSSGSTGHPKTISWTHRMMTLWGQAPARSELDMKGAIMGCHGTPMFHGLGSFLWSAAPSVGLIISVFKPASPPTIPTPEAVWSGIVATNADYSWTVPSFVEEWARDPEKVAFMRNIKGLIFGGASLNDEVGNSLASKGVTLYSMYGCTEAGMINSFGRLNPGMEWAYWQVNPDVKCFFQPVGDGMYEVIVLSREVNPLPKTNTKIGDQEAYATTDLVVPHPTKPGLWKIVGRADEQIILSNGEKTNPLPLEKIINDDPHVKSSVMFGRGKFQNGVLIEPTEDYAIDPNDSKQLEAFRNKIWRTIEAVNEYAPQHSRIFKEMILVTSPSKPFQFTVKGQPRRNFILEQYHDEIEKIYKEVESSAQTELEPPAIWNQENTLNFVRAVVSSTLRREIADEADIFRSGGDSLQATWIRNTILRAVRETDQKAPKRLPVNLVFAAPTVASLSRLVHEALHSDSVAASHKPEDLWKYVEKYSANLPARPDNLVERPAGKEIVVITGTTGGFGCDTLEHLLKDETVEKVYAFNRKGTQALERQRAQFRARGLDETLLDSPKFTMVEAVLHELGFGLEPGLLDEIRRSVTHIMYNAWKVNFNLSIASFEVDIQGARNFIDLALTSPYKKPPSIIFVSSIGALSNCTLPAPVPEASMDDPNFPFGSGYSESKWVTEHVLQNVSKQTDVHTIVMRLGQVAGDRLGYWNEKEWFPALVKSALFQHCLPDLEGDVAWFPAYEAAKAFAEMRHSPERYLHLVHPRPTPWHTIIAPIAEALNVPLVPYEQWLSALQSSFEPGSAEEVEAMKQNPALRILPFFKAQATHMTPDREPMGLVLMSTEKAAKVSKAFTEMPQLDADRAVRWVDAWRKSGFLQ